MSDDPNAPRPSSPSEGDGHDPLVNPIYNWLSIIGLFLVLASATATLFFFVVGLVVAGGGSYSVLTLVPPFVIGGVGALMAIAGYVRERWRQKRGRQSSFHDRYVIDPSRIVRGMSPLVIGSGIVLGTLVVLSGGAGSVALVEYTSANSFCGEVCHEVMHPEATVYTESPHSEIACVECHVGSGADSYINAKLNGLRQVYLMATGEITRPIPTPIHDPIDSKRICGNCHTLDRLDEYKTVTRSYHLNTEEPRSMKLRMVMKVGSNGGKRGRQGAGIHYHMQVAKRVEYIARDAQRQDIAWVRVTGVGGKVREYNNEDDPLTEEQRAGLEVHEMGCIDCHSRPAHQFDSPVDAVNSAMQANLIRADIPYIKAAAVTALADDYDGQGDALDNLGKNLREYYEDEYPDELEKYSKELDGVVPELQKIYRATMFPEMKADWRAHPNNIGHRDSPGCFRCHSDTMVDEDGEALFTDCYSCHAILVEDDEIVEAAEFDKGLDFVHPEDWDTIEDFTLCTDCHSGGADVYE